MDTIFQKNRKLPIQVKASFWFLIASFFQRGISVITTPLFTRLLTAEEYGQFNVFNSWFSLFTIIIALNLTGGAYTQGIIKFSEEREKFSSSIHGLSLSILVIWLIIYVIIWQPINNLLKLETYQVLALFLLVGTNSISGFWFLGKRVDFDYKPLVIITILTAVLRPATELGLVLYMSDHVKARIYGWVLVYVITYSWMCVHQFMKDNTFFCKKYWKYALAFNIPLVPHYLSQTVLNMSDRIMISQMVGDREAGVYSLAYSIALIMTLFNTSIINTLTPWALQMIKEGNQNKIGNVFYICMLIIGGVNILLILFAPELVRIFAPSEYYEAIWVIPPVSIGTYFMFLYNLLAVFEFYFEKTKFIMVASVLAAVLNIILNVVCIRAFGYVAAGYTTLICYIVYVVCHYNCYKKTQTENNPGKYALSGSKFFWISFVITALGLLLAASYFAAYIRYGISLILIVSIILLRSMWLPIARNMLREMDII